MRSAVHAHCLFLLKVRNKDFSSLPAPPSTADVPKDGFNKPSTQVQSQGFQSYCKNELHKLGLKRFTWDLESSWQHPFNKLMSMVFYCTFHLALVSTKYHHYSWNKDHNNYGVVADLMEQYFTYLKTEWKSMQKDVEYLTCECSREWCDTAKFPILASQFNDPPVCSDTEEVVENLRQVYHKVGLCWRSALFNDLVLKIDQETEFFNQIKKGKKPIDRLPEVQSTDDGDIPEGLSFQVFD
ncbi:hypothetical protein O181_101741 [Austropuccinia psidii MF-1]|uniref:Uncharacterized protein n=1 Tax=Austropuccinia psidii MF-1 TaxID=1389203 RepID=A0A9Q3PIY1_9BASI|nr:hypothetical protein [Austropuccinia psidii MF-1]